MDTQKMELITKTKSKTTKRGRYIYIILWLLHPKQINCPNLISWLNIIFLRFSEMDARGARGRVIEFNGGQLPSINGLSLYEGTRTPSIGQRYCVNQLFDLEHPATENIEVSPRANCISFVLFFWHRDFFDYRTRTGARALMYQTIRYHPEPNSDNVPKKKNGTDTINCGAKKKSRRKKRENYSGMYNADPIQETNIDIVSYPKYERLHLAMRKIPC